MRGRKPEKFQLKLTDKAYLRKLLRDGETPWRIARRAQILLQRADQEQRVGALGEKLEQNVSTIDTVGEIVKHASQKESEMDREPNGRKTLGG
jgi:hypothetical protein